MIPDPILLKKSPIVSSGRSFGAASNFIEKQQAHGQVTFTIANLREATGLSVKAARDQLARLDYRVARVSPRKDFFLIVSPEQRTMGAPPVLWWIDAFFMAEKRPYYVGLLSAAAEHGSSHQAVQEVQVITNRPMKELTIGRLRVSFFVKRHLADTPTTAPAQAYAPVILSSPEATALDLLRYSHRIGGAGRAAETIQGLLGRFKKTSLRQALLAEGEASNIQRLGYVLDQLGSSDLCKVVAEHMPKRLEPVFLEPHKPLPEGAAETTSRRWSIIVNTNIKDSFQ